MSNATILGTFLLTPLNGLEHHHRCFVWSRLLIRWSIQIHSLGQVRGAFSYRTLDQVTEDTNCRRLLVPYIPHRIPTAPDRAPCDLHPFFSDLASPMTTSVQSSLVAHASLPGYKLWSDSMTPSPAAQAPLGNSTGQKMSRVVKRKEPRMPTVLDSAAATMLKWPVDAVSTRRADTSFPFSAMDERLSLAVDHSRGAHCPTTESWKANKDASMAPSDVTRTQVPLRVSPNESEERSTSVVVTVFILFSLLVCWCVWLFYCYYFRVIQYRPWGTVLPRRSRPSVRPLSVGMRRADVMMLAS